MNFKKLLVLLIISLFTLTSCSDQKLSKLEQQYVVGENVLELMSHHPLENI